MTEDRWKQILGNIKDNFEVLEEGSEHMDEEGGMDIEFIEFKGPLGHMRLEFISKPVVTGKKTNYTRRIGSETAVEYTYSDEERSEALNAYKWDEAQNDWVEIDANSFA